MPLLQTNLEGDYLPQCFRCTSDKPGSLLLLVFSEIQPSLFTPVSSSLPVVMLLCFNSQSALDLKSDWPELLPSSVMRKREELWGRDCHYPRVSTGAHPLTKKPEDSGYEIVLIQVIKSDNDPGLTTIYFLLIITCESNTSVSA